MNDKSALRLADTFYATLFTELDACGLGGLVKAVDNGLRVIGHREHAAVRLCFDRDAARGEPVDGVLCLPAVKGAA